MNNEKLTPLPGLWHLKRMVPIVKPGVCKINHIRFCYGSIKRSPMVWNYSIFNFQSHIDNRELEYAYSIDTRYHPRFMYRFWAWKCELIGYQGAIYQKESTLSDQPILLRRLAKFGPMEPQSGIFWTILASGIWALSYMLRVLTNLANQIEKPHNQRWPSAQKNEEWFVSLMVLQSYTYLLMHRIFLHFSAQKSAYFQFRITHAH